MQASDAGKALREDVVCELETMSYEDIERVFLAMEQTDALSEADVEHWLLLLCYSVIVFNQFPGDGTPDDYLRRRPGIAVRPYDDVYYPASRGTSPLLDGVPLSPSPHEFKAGSVYGRVHATPTGIALTIYARTVNRVCKTLLEQRKAPAAAMNAAAVFYSDWAPSATAMAAFSLVM